MIRLDYNKTKRSENMSEMILQSKTLPEPLLRLISTEKVRISESDGEIRLIPVEDSATSIVSDPFFSEANMARLRKSILQMETTGGTIHDISIYEDGIEDD
jgi:DNA-damage-inducible protein J